MTTDRNVDRIVAAWLDLMPSEAPDRALTAVLEAVATEPQARVFAPALRRSPLMTRLLIAATVAALAIAGVGGAILISGGRPSTAPTAPSTPPSAEASSGLLPSAMLQEWIGAQRDIPGIGTSEKTSLVFLADSVSLIGQDYVGRQFRSTARVDGSQLEVTSGGSGSAAAGGCATGDVGRYTWSVSPGGSRLSLEGIGDDCAARTTAFNGEWYRIACKATNTCFGQLEAGTYPTVGFGAQLGPDDAPAATVGALSYTVPDGWAIASDHISDIRLVRSSAYALETADGPPDDSDAIEAWIRPAALAPDTTCDWGVAPDVERTPDALVESIASHPLLDAGDPTSITVDGHDGRMVDFAIADSRTETCGFPRPVAPLLGEAIGTGGSIGGEPYVVGIMSPARMRLIFLDLGGERTVAIVIRSVDPARFEDFLAEAMPIVESFDFN